ncbi:Por secretion system C-terminal sorting domain-containing protein [Chryseobacterium soldanellicola]|uniref:Por secretion system C-terminal sorting domain-containing protein n=1 Tax=Chryseobacterium soldanellicola TaxID=311333 RepID=A0A1H1CME9_9FLAO|nr:S8 family serine peptidase [Chryseobacterium soldanellicola]SDQ65352.1 Por secretion system C-terminal sorting domain-containing protein [Chryseobacterium soldanellicola]
MKIKILTLVLSLFMILGISAQSKYFYYYNGKKYFLQLDKSSIAISSSTTRLAKNLKPKTPIVESYTKNSLFTDGKKVTDNTKTFYVEVESDATVTDEQYISNIKEKNANPDVILASPCFLTSEGQKMGMSNNFYVKLKSKNGIKALQELAAKNNAEVLGYNEYMPLWFTVACNKNSTFPTAIEMANLFYESGHFESTEPEFIYHNLQTTADPLFPNQWSLKNTGQYGSAYTGIDIKAEQAWTLSTGANVKTAIYDQGVEMNHPDLAANIFGTGFDAQTNSAPSIVRGDHATPCAGITGAVQNNNLGGSGVAPNTKLISISISLEFSNTPQQLANGFNWATANGVDVISNSWGGYAPSPIIENAITNALVNGRGGKGMVVVFAAGNENNTAIRYPGSWNPKILVVGALSPCGERKSPSSCDGENWWGSCYGSQLDIMAPGVKMPTSDRQGANGYDPSNYIPNFNGTSSACPVIAGVAALILSVNPCLTAQQVRDIIEQTAQKVRTDLYAYGSASGRPNGTWHNQMGYGLVNAYAAVVKAKSMYSLAAFDSAADVGIEPNPSATTWANIYQSPDIWNRRTNSALLNLTHQDPGYGGLGSNVMRFRVHNIGCTTSAPSFARLYWTMGSTGETWPNSWNGIQLINGFSAGGELTTPYTGFNSSNSYATGQGFKIPALAPGQTYIIDAKWNPVNPVIYGGLTDNVVCFLGRIVTPGDPMYNENPGPGAPIEPNVTNNNNVVTRNTRLVNLSGTFLKQTGFFFGNYFDHDNPFDIRFNLIKDSNTPFKNIGRVVIKLNDIAWQRWEEGGKQLEGLQVLNYNEHEFIVIDPLNAAIKNVNVKVNEYFPIALTFQQENTSITSPENYDFAVSQSVTNNPDELYGSVCHFLVSMNQKDVDDGDPFCDDKCREAKMLAMVLQDVKLSPNPASSNATLEFNLMQDAKVNIILAEYNGTTLKTISNAENLRKGISKKTFSISDLPNGVYVVSIIANNEKKSVHLIVKH